LKENIQNTL